MKLNQKGLDLIKQFEGCRLVSYPDPATGGKPWTIGYGHTGSDITMGISWTQEQADLQLLNDATSAGNQIKKCLSLDLNDNQFSALISLVFNIGIGNFKSSTLLKALNAGGFKEAASQFLVWDKAAGRVMAGLTKRRKAEKLLFETPVG
jgi:lysozyme